MAELRTGAGPGLQTACASVGVLFLLVGVLGFVPGITTGHAGMTFAGSGSQAMLFGVFAVSVLHNIVHLVFGVLGLAMAWATLPARVYLLAGGLIYLALWAYGMLIDSQGPANFVPVNAADNWLHLGLGLAMVLLGLWLARSSPGPETLS